MRKMTQEEFDSFKPEDTLFREPWAGKYRTFPGSTDYSDIRAFGDSTEFGGWTRFGDLARLGHMARFGDFAQFGMSALFGNMAQFGDSAQFGMGARFGNEVQFGNWACFGDGAEFGNKGQFGHKTRFSKYTSFGHGVKFGDEAEFGSNTQFGNDARFGSGARFEHLAEAKPGNPLIQFDRFNTLRLCLCIQFFNTVEGIWVRFGDVLLSIDDFRKFVDGMSSERTLLDMANIANEYFHESPRVSTASNSNKGEVFRRVAAVLRTIGTIWVILAFFFSINVAKNEEEKIVITLFLFAILGFIPAGTFWTCAWIIEGAVRSK